MKETLDAERTAEKLDRIIELLEDLFILQASSARMKRQELRAVVGLDMKRVNKISKHIKPLLEAIREGAVPAAEFRKNRNNANRGKRTGR